MVNLPTLNVAGFNRNLLMVEDDNFDYVKDNFAKILQDMSITGVFFNYIENKALDFITTYPNLTQLVVGRCKNLAYPDLRLLPNLQYLQLADDNRAILNLQGLSKLETISANLHQGFIGLEDLNLSTLILFGVKDADKLVLPASIKTLKIVRLNSKTLDFLHGLNNLEVLSLSYLKNLQNVTALSSLRNLKSLEFFSLKGLDELNPLAKIKNLQQLRFDSCQVNSLDFLRGCDGLSSLVIYNTNIIDGDLHPVLALKHLDFLTLTHKKHFNLKEKQIKELLNIQAID